MSCSRCQGLMVSETLFNPLEGSIHTWVPLTRCLIAAMLRIHGFAARVRFLINFAGAPGLAHRDVDCGGRRVRELGSLEGFPLCTPRRTNKVASAHRLKQPWMRTGNES